MKKIVLLTLILLAMSVVAYAAEIKSIDEATRAKEDTPVLLEGVIIGVVDSDDGEYIFQDNTGVVLLDISDRANNYRDLKVNDKVRVNGKVDIQNHYKNEISIDAFSVDKI